MLELRIANHCTVLGEIRHRIIALNREALVASLRNRAGSEKQDSNKASDYQRNTELFYQRNTELFHS
jgi:hypothetical protein